MPSLAGAGVEEHRRAAAASLADIRPPIRAAAIMSAIDGDAGRNAVHPAQAALRVAVWLDAAGWLPVQSAGERPMRPVQPMLGRSHLKHDRMKTAMHK